MPSRKPRIKQHGGIIILKKFLSNTEQKEVFDKCVEVDEAYDPGRYYKQFHKIRPEELKEKKYFQWYAYRSYKEKFGSLEKYMTPFKSTIRKNLPKLKLTTKLTNQIKNFISTPDYYVIGIAYPQNGIIHPHKDGWTSMNVTISLGDSCKLDYEDNDTMKSCTLNSGDLVLFDGNSIEHGVSTIYLSTAPAWFERAKRNGLRRFNLQFRLDDRPRPCGVKLRSRFVTYDNFEPKHQ